MKIILIPCSDRKIPRGSTEYDPSVAIYSLLPRSLGDRILDCRAELASLLALPSGPDFGKGSSEPIQYLPAFERYDGNLYRAANLKSEDIQGASGKQILIISALYGVVLPQEFIRHYQLSMSYRLPSALRVYTWWRRHRLGTIVSEIAAHLGATEINDLLSEDYRSALLPWPPSAYVTKYYKPEFRKLGWGTDFHRGTDLRKILAQT